MTPNAPHPIVLTAFGALSTRARRIYTLFEEEVRRAHPHRRTLWAYTASSLVARLKAQGHAAMTLAETYARLREEGFTSAAVVSLHLVPGEKHQEVLAESAQGLRVAHGLPLLFDEGDIPGVGSDLLRDLPVDRPVLVVAHGHGHEARYNTELLALGQWLHRTRPDLWLVRLEGEEDPSGLERFIAQARQAGKVHVVPFLLVAGDHVVSDILGDDPESFKSRLNVPNFTCGEALGLRPWVRRRFLGRVNAALAALETP